MTISKPLRVGIVAGESSGDLLGAGLIAALKQRHPDAVFEGIGGPLMIAEGFTSHVPMERLAVMGLVEVLGRLFELLKVRRNLRNHFIANPPDVFIGIDAPDFTLGLEKKLKRAGIKTVHYVGPQIWAWRQGRAKHIAAGIDLMLVLFPFEREFFAQHDVPVTFVGHPLADAIDMDTPQQPARDKLNLDPRDRVIGLLPGSRQSEARRLAPTFLQAANLCRTRISNGKIIVAAATDAGAAIIADAVAAAGIADVQIVTRQARDVMAASDVILSASGTATLEVSLVKRPMVVAYKMANLTFRIARRLVKIDYIALPNLLAGRELVPEIIQQDATPENLAQALLRYFEAPELTSQLHESFAEIHRALRQDASVIAAQAVLELVAGPSGPPQ